MSKKKTDDNVQAEDGIKARDLIELEKGVEFVRESRERQYPFLEMELDDSFFVAKNKRRFAPLVSYYNRKYGPKKWNLKVADKFGIKGTRVWRTA